MKKVIIGAMALTVGLLLPGYGNETKIETGTYTCSVEGTEIMKWVFDMENHTYDMIVKGESQRDKLTKKELEFKMIIEDYNKKTQEYKLTEHVKHFTADIRYVKRNDDVFEIRMGSETGKLPCKKE